MYHTLLILQTALLRRWFCQWLEESSKDFRVGAEALKDLRYAVFGCGNSLYADNFNKACYRALSPAHKPGTLIGPVR